MSSVWLPDNVTGIENRSVLITRQSFAVERFRHKSYRLEGIPPNRSHIVALRLKGRCFAERHSEGLRATKMTGLNSITILPAHQESAWRVCGEGEVAYFYLGEKMVQLIASQEFPFDRKRRRVEPRLGIVDRQLAVNARSILQEIEENGHRSLLFLESLVVQMIVGLIRRQSTAGASRFANGRKIEPFNRTMAQRLIDYIEAHLTANLSLTELCAIVNLSPSHFSHRFKATFGLTPHRMVLNMRIERAKMLLATNALPMAELALALGFSDQAHFITTFRKAVGLTPAAFRATI